MQLEELKTWKKVLESDLQYVVKEMKNFIQEKSALFLEGDVGAGKTTFCRYYFDKYDISSPSYSIINEWGDLVHADFYRLESAEEITHLEIPLYLEEKNYFVIEWGIQYYSVLKQYLPQDFEVFKIVISSSETTSDEKPRDYKLLKIE